MALAIEAQHATPTGHALRSGAGMQAVLDPNVRVSAVLSGGGTPAALLRARLEGGFELLVSSALLGELERSCAPRRSPNGSARTRHANSWTCCACRSASSRTPTVHPWSARRTHDDYLIPGRSSHGSNRLRRLRPARPRRSNPGLHPHRLPGAASPHLTHTVAPSTARPAPGAPASATVGGDCSASRRVTRGADQPRVLAHEQPSNQSTGGRRRRRAGLARCEQRGRRPVAPLSRTRR